MKTLVPTPSLRTLVLLALLLAANSTRASVRYVWQDSPSPGPPYTNWTAAAHVIQDAVDAAQTGDEIVVTNGVYATGGRAVGTNVLVNRVAMDKPLTLRSVNGPQFTTIQGYQVPGTTSGDGAIRCVYLADGASLSGFTLTNGATRNWSVPGFDESEYSGGGLWCESETAVVSNCVMLGNSAYDRGGGACGGTLTNCTLTGNSAAGSGGGASHSTLTSCTLTGNSAYDGGGAFDSTLTSCTLSGNSADYFGGGALFGTLNSCAVIGNSAGQEGGGIYQATLNNCTITGNSAESGGGVGSGLMDTSKLNNCIVYYNTARDGTHNYSSSEFNYSCTTPLPAGGVGNISADPQLASGSHLSAGSPCRGAGSAAYATGTDIDGEAWGTPPSIGCDEYHAGAVTGPLSVGIVGSHTNVSVGFPVSLVAAVEGRTTASVWEFGDGGVLSNRPCASHAWAVPGDYPVVLRAYNESHPEGVWATVTVRVVAQPIHYVAAASTNPLPPYASWGTAAGSIQDAVDAVMVPGALVLVSNGVYATGGRAVQGTMTNRVVVQKPLILRSVNGPQFTTIQGYQVPGTTNGDGAIRCVYLADGASLSGFTLTNGATRKWPETSDDREWNGGGVWCESMNAAVSNCLLTGNSAFNGGGGAARGTLDHCTLTGNSASGGGGACGGTLNSCAVMRNSADYGGGAWDSTLNNCTVTGNTADYGGGVEGGALNNCIVYFNTAGRIAYYSDNGGETAFMNYCCTTPLPPSGSGNIALDPQLATTSHLSAGSPCRGAGSAAYASGTDIDGEVWASPPSIGCDEYHAGAVIGALSVEIAVPSTSVATSFPLDLTALIEGRTTATVWDFGDGVVVSNRPYATHAWTVPGDRTVVLRAYNESHLEGVIAKLTIHVVQAIHYVSAGSTNPLSPYTSWETAAASIQDAVDAATVSGALVLVSNGVYATAGRAVFGTMTNRVAVDKPLILRSVNGAQFTVIQGYQVPAATNGDGAIRCVYLATGASLSGFTLTNGATRNAGDQVREQSGGGVWCESANADISNCVVAGNSAQNAGGVYGGTLSNCMLAGNWARYYGGGAYYTTLNTCTLSTNSAGDSGGGAYYSTVDNCTLTGNSANNGGGTSGGSLNNCTLSGNSAIGQWPSGGGGASDCTLYNCTLTGNSAFNCGGGAAGGTLNNCTLTDNAASWGGGVAYSTLNNCIVYFNMVRDGDNYDPYTTLNYCCTAPMPNNGVGNITLDPLFVDRANGNLRLQTDSPCINSGNNTFVVGSTDLDGNPRIVSGTVDIGAYEFQGPGSVISYAWLQQYGLPTDGSADFADPDHDGQNNWQEWRCLTDPTNALSVLRLLSAAPIGTNVTVTWQSVAGVNYFLERSKNLGASVPFSPLVIGIPGQAGMTSYADTSATNTGPYFYRVGVNSP